MDLPKDFEAKIKQLRPNLVVKVERPRTIIPMDDEPEIHSEW